MSKIIHKECELVKILLPKSGTLGNEFRGGILRLSEITSFSEIDEYVVLQSKSYEDIFDKPLKDSSRFKKLLSIIKVSYIDDEGKKHSIHRAFRSAAAVDFNGNYAALTPSSMRLLCAEQGEKVILEKGSILPFFLFHPNRAVLSSTWVGLIGILLSIISIFISLLLYFI
jgi:hypothetical protein